MSVTRLNAAHDAAHEVVAVDLSDRLSRAYERMLRRAGRDMASAFRSRAQPIVADASLVPPDGDEVVPSADDLYREVQRRGATVRRDAADAISDSLASVGGISFDVGGVFDDDLLDAVGSKTVFAADLDLRAIYGSVVEEAVERGWSVPKTAKAISRAVADAAEGHAKTYARTELNGLANGGSNAAAQKVLAGRDSFKVWVATNDLRTRESHVLAHGQTVGINESFRVGGASMRYPGDPYGPGDEVYNCRCTLVYTDERADGDVVDNDPISHVRPSADLVDEIARTWSDDNVAHHFYDEITAGERIRGEELDLRARQFREQLESKLRREMTNVRIAVRTPADIAETIIADGRFKSQFETQTSSGMLSNSRRARAEEHLFSYPEDTPARDRPIYGYLTEGASSENGFVTMYGDVKFVLKRDVNERATFTGIDSLGRNVAPSPIKQPSITSVSTANVPRDNPLTSPLGAWRTEYWETQVHNGLSLDDVERIEVVDYGMSSQPLAETAESLRRTLDQNGYKIPVTIVSALVGGAEQRAGLGDDRVRVEVVGDVGPVAARDDRLDAELGMNDPDQAVEHAALGAVGVTQRSAGEQEERLVPPDRDHVHADHRNVRDGGRRRGRGLRSQAATAGGNDMKPKLGAATNQPRQGIEVPLGETATLTVDADVEAPPLQQRDPIPFEATLAIEGEETEDGRLIEVDATTWRDLPLTLMGMTENPEFGGHAGAQVSGRIDSIERRGSEIVGVGDLTTEFGVDTLAPMIADKTVRGVSVDLAVMDYEIRDAETGEKLDPEEEMEAWFEGRRTVFVVLDGIILGATVCPMPAIANTQISVIASATTRHGITLTLFVPFKTALAAAAAEEHVEWTVPSRDAFETTEFPGPTPLTVTDDGRVFGHLATWDTCHTGIAGVCTTAPRSPSGYAYFHVGEIATAEGVPVAVGKIMLGTKHASLAASRMQATRHYDDNGQVGAYVRATDGEHGIWLSGYVAPNTDAQMVELRANPPSGDWRAVNGQLELVAACCVPVPGFPVPRAEANIAASADQVEVTAMIASSGPIVPEARVRDALVAAGCGCEDTMPVEGVDDLADLAA